MSGGIIWSHRSGVGVTKPISSIPLFSSFSTSPKHTLAIEYHVYIWRVSPQLSCGDTCQILMWFKESNRYFCKIETFDYGEINERSFSNPHSWSTGTSNGLLADSTKPLTDPVFTKILGNTSLYIYKSNDLATNHKNVFENHTFRIVLNLSSSQWVKFLLCLCCSTVSHLKELEKEDPISI